MKLHRRQRQTAIWRADFFSAKDFARHAVLITLAYLAADLAGLREFTSILNGTAASLELGRTISALLGIGYVLLYLAFVLLVPVLVLAATLLVIWKKLLLTKTGTPAAAYQMPATRQSSLHEP